jgi:hypothetical protein
MEIGTQKSRAAMAVIRSNEPSGGVSRISYRCTAARRRASPSGVSSRGCNLQLTLPLAWSDLRITSGVRGHSSSEDGGDESDHDIPLNARHGIT